MKRLLSFILLSALGISPVFASVIDDQISEALNDKAQQELSKNAEELNEKITFSKVNSCASMESILSGFLDTYRKLNPQRNYDYRLYNWIKWLWATMMVEDVAVYNSSVDYAVAEKAESIQTSISDFSTTNIQKAWVDEPDILKSNGKYLFYYAQERNSNYVNIIDVKNAIETPKADDLSNIEIVKKISIPNNLYNVQLFLNWNNLVILASRYASSNYDSILWSARSLVIVYDISDVDNLVLEKMTEVYWYFEDARMINDQIYLISSINLSRYNIAWSDKPIVFNDIQPKLTDITLKSAQTPSSAKTYTKRTSTIPCDSIFYLLPSEETMKETGIYPNFTLISQISLSDVSAAPKQNLVFGNVNEIHMSQSSLYLPSPIYLSRPTNCSLYGCISSWYYRDENTLIHKFNLWKSVSYLDSTIIPGTPLNQYAMDEDDNWNFRILTTTRYDQNATHLFVLDDKLKLKWSLMNIEPGENFKSSRYIWDKLYLVTYQTIDPLFVVDIEDISNPKIIWELKIPGYSTYLHPYSDARNWIQYLIGLGYSTTDNWYGWLKTDKIKVDLYKIDYNMKETVETKCSSLITKNVDSSKSNSCLSSATPCGQEQMIYESCVADVNPNNIAVSLVASHEFDWDSGDSPALYNPRVFVRRSAKQELLLPIETRTMLEEWTRENNWKYKYDTFIWLKWLSIKSSTALIKEILSENFVDFGGDDYYYWNFDAARVGYIEDIYYFLDNWFAAFIRNGKVATIGTI